MDYFESLLFQGQLKKKEFHLNLCYFEEHLLLTQMRVIEMVLYIELDNTNYNIQFDIQKIADNNFGKLYMLILLPVIDFKKYIN